MQAGDNRGWAAARRDRWLRVGPVLGLGLTLGLAPGLGGCDDDAPGETQTVTGKQNGARCLIGPNGASICRGDRCLELTSPMVGVCSETCGDSCRFGGECGLFPGGDQACVMPCTSGADCQENFLCQPVPGLQICADGACGIRFDNLYCVPPT